MSKEAMKLALEALEVLGWQPTEEAMDYRDNAITALREALAEQPAQQEPVAWCTKNNLKNMAKGFTQDVPARAMRVRQPYPKESIVLLYTAPPAQRTWVGLTEKEIFECRSANHLYFYKAIEAKLKEKNT